MNRLTQSWFGLKKIGRIIVGYTNRRRILGLIKKGRALTTQKELQKLLGAPALINDLEVPVLQEYAQLASDVIVEIGVAYGGSALLFMLGKKPQARVYSVDPFVKDSMGNFRATRELCSRHVTRALKGVGLDEGVGRWVLLPDYSYAVVKNWQRAIDLLFIDGDHHYRAVKQDFADWFAFVKKGGLILFHDSCRVNRTPDGVYNRGWPGPSRLVRELQQDSRVTLEEQVHSLSIFKKS